MSKTPAGKNRELVPVKDNFELEVLQTQYKELKEKVSDLWFLELTSSLMHVL